MEYNESYFKAKSNAKARTVWLILIAIMTLSYGSETSQGLHSAKYYTTFLLMAWVPFFIGILVLKINEKLLLYTRKSLPSVTVRFILTSSLPRIPRSLSAISCL